MVALLCACAKNKAKTAGSAETSAIMPVAQEPSQINAGIEGAWVWRPAEIPWIGNFERDLSWGRRVFPQETKIIVDLHSATPIIETRSSWTTGEITGIIEKGDETQLRFLWRDTDTTVTFHFNEDGTMWIEPLTDDRFVFGSTGKDRPYSKIDGLGFSAEMDAIQAALQGQPALERSVLLPYKTMAGGIPLVIKADGTIEFGSNEFKYMTVQEEDPFSNEILLITYRKNNLLGMSILIQYYDTGVAEFACVFNTATGEKVSRDTSVFYSFWNLLALDDLLILASDREAYAFDSFTGELMWTQTYTQKESDPITGNDGYLIITDVDGNIYKIFGDGRKELSEPGN